MRSTLLGIAVNLILVLIKGTAGVVGHSYALIADAVESATDVLSSLIVWWGLRLSARPADANHPQGHGKAEPMAAAVVGVLLLGAAILVAWQSVQEILVPHTMPAPWTLLVVVGVMGVKWVLSRHVFAVASETESLAVKGDAWHHRSDALTSLAAFIGIGVALIGGAVSPDPRWSAADDWAAMIAAAVIALNGFTILRGAVYELSDPHPGEELEAEVRRIAAGVSGVANLHKCFVRKMGFDYYVELDVRVDRHLPVYRGHEIAHAVQDAVRREMAGRRFARVLVHIEPTLE